MPIRRATGQSQSAGEGSIGRPGGARAQQEGHPEMATQLSFSEIYDRGSVDSSSKLSYHLNELTGTFLRKHENGYAFTTPAGDRPGSFWPGTTSNHRPSTR